MEKLLTKAANLQIFNRTAHQQHSRSTILPISEHDIAVREAENKSKVSQKQTVSFIARKKLENKWTFQGDYTLLPNEKIRTGFSSRWRLKYISVSKRTLLLYCDDFVCDKLWLVVGLVGFLRSQAVALAFVLIGSLWGGSFLAGYGCACAFKCWLKQVNGFLETDFSLHFNWTNI